MLRVISKSQMMPIALEKCPAFAPEWEKHRDFWVGEEAGIFNDIGAFAHFVVDAYERRDIQSVDAAFEVIEYFLDAGDEEVRAAASIGFLEDVQNIASHQVFGSSVFLKWLGPKSKLAWTEIEEMWRGKRSLADVVRAERSAEEKRKKGRN
ncbi:MAG: DUF7674 family protein [Acetobacteraceae bacterium]